jgi:MFS family permease
MNAQAVVVQQHAGRPIMNSLHGYFTLGTLIGSAIGGLLAVLEVGPVPHFLAMTLLGMFAVTLAARHLLPDTPSVAERPSRAGLALPPRALLPLGLLALCAGLAEGSMYDWSALYVNDELHASESTGSLAFATFSLAMLVGRFGGDRVVARVGSMNVVRYGGLLAAAGLLAGLLIHTVAGALAGFVCLGLGLSVLMPLLYSAGGSFPGIPSVQGVAAIATMGFLGLLAGPPLLGSIADAVSLRLALGIVVILCGAMALLAGALRVTEPANADPASMTTSPDLPSVPLPEAAS